MESLVVILLIWIFVLQLSVNELRLEVKKTRGKDVSKKTFREFPQDSLEVSVDTLPNDNPKPNYVSCDIPKSPEELPVEKDSGFENFFLGNIFNKVGALAIIIAVGIFIKLISPLIIFTPQIKTFLGFSFGIVLLFISFFLHKDNTKNYAEVLMGTGVASLFITTYCAYGLLHTINMPVALGIATLILCGTYVVADRLKTNSMLFIGLIGGYFNPLILNPNASANFIFIYLLFLNAITMTFAIRNRDKEFLNLLNLILTFLVIVGYSFKSTLCGWAPFSLWVLYLLYDFILLSKFKSHNALNWLNYAIITIFVIDKFNADKIYLAASLFIITIISLLFAFLQAVKGSNGFKSYVYFSVLNIWFAVYFFANDMASIAIWSVTAMVLAWLSVKYEKLKSLDNFSVAYFITVLIGIFMVKVNGNLCITADYKTLINPRLVLFGIPVVSLYFSGNFTRLSKDNLYRYLILILGFIYSHFECADFVSSHSNLNVDYLTSVVWTLYAGIITSIGILKNVDYMKNVGIWLSILAIGRIFLHDVATLAMVYKLLAFVVLGFILMVVSYFYVKVKK